MSRYKSRTTKNIVTVIDLQGIGMGDKLLGVTLVIFKFEDDYDSPRVMEHKDFHLKYKEIIQ
jgi:hypothetical protein